MRITNFGRPVGEFPLFRLRDGRGGWFLTLSRVDVSDIGNVPRAEPFYKPFFKREARDGMQTWEFHAFNRHLILFFTQRGIQHYVEHEQRRQDER